MSGGGILTRPSTPELGYGGSKRRFTAGPGAELRCWLLCWAAAGELFGFTWESFARGSRFGGRKLFQVWFWNTGSVPVFPPSRCLLWTEDTERSRAPLALAQQPPGPHAGPSTAL